MLVVPLELLAVEPLELPGALLLVGATAVPLAGPETVARPLTGLLTGAALVGAVLARGVLAEPVLAEPVLAGGALAEAVPVEGAPAVAVLVEAAPAGGVLAGAALTGAEAVARAAGEVPGMTDLPASEPDAGAHRAPGAGGGGSSYP